LAIDQTKCRVVAFGGVLPLGVLYLPNTPVGLFVSGGRLRSVGQNSGHREELTAKTPRFSSQHFSAFHDSVLSGKSVREIRGIRIVLLL